MLNIVFLILGLTVLIIGANLLVDGASSIAKKLHVSDMVIGLTIVSIGTSAPELTVSVVAAINGNTEIVMGNIIGSNIFNILLILGISAAIFPLVVQNNTQYKEIPFSLFAAFLVLILANDVFIDKAEINIISRIDGLVLLFFFLFFLYYIFQIAKKEDVIIENKKYHSTGISVLYIVLGVAGLVFGGKYFVEGAIFVARSIGMSEKMIGLTIIAGGTSLPELATSVVAAIKRNPDIAVGNVVGSNIFNIFLILGVTALIKPISFNPNLNFDVIFLIIVSSLLLISTYTLSRRKIDRIEGYFFIAIYIVYIIYLSIYQIN